MLMLPKGLSSQGHALLDSSYLQLGGSGKVVYLDSSTGDDTDSGLSRSEAVATLAQAITNTASGDVIVVLSTHSESIAADTAITKGLVILGESSTAGTPTATFNLDAASTTTGNLLLSNLGVVLVNLKFVCTLTDGPAIQVGAGDHLIEGCRFECDTAMDGANCMDLSSSATRLQFRDCTWVVTDAGSASTLPGKALDGVHASASDISFVGCTFDGGPVGFTADAIDFTEAHSKVTFEDLSLLRGADADLSGITTGYVAGLTSTGSSRVITGQNSSYYPAGTGETSGTNLATASPVYVLANGATVHQIWYVNSVTGTDAASPAGLRADEPLKKLAQALTNAVDGDWIVLQDGHNNTGESFSVTEEVVVVGGGTATVDISSTGTFVTSTASGQEFHGITLISGVFVPSPATNWVLWRDCTVTGGITLNTGSDDTRFESCTFSGAANRPHLDSTDALTHGNIWMRDCSFDAQLLSSASPTIAVDLRDITISRLRGQGLSLKNGAELRIDDTFGGYIHVSTATDGGKVQTDD